MNIKTFLIYSCLWDCASTQALDVTNLKCELKTNPIGITKARPSFSWTFIGDETSTKQGGFRIMMATSIEKLKYPDLWDTGPTSNSETGYYQYLGEPLKSGQKVTPETLLKRNSFIIC